MKMINTNTLKPLALALYIGGFTFFYLLTTISSDKLNLGEIRYPATFAYVAFLVLLAGPQRLLDREQTSFLIFVGCSSLVLVVSAEYYEAAMWILWYLYVFIVFRKVVDLNPDAIIRLLSFLVFALIAFAAMLYFYAEAIGLGLAWDWGGRYRFTSGVDNPSIYSKFIATIFWLAFALYLTNRKKIYIVISVVAFSLLMYVDARTDLYGAFLGIIAYSVLVRRRIFWILVIALFAVLILASWVMFNLSLDNLNGLLSGRVKLWHSLILESQFLGSGTRFFFGTGIALGSVHYDNQWLEFMLRFGVVGLIVFLYPAARAFKLLRRVQRRTDSEKIRVLSVWGQALMVSFAAMGMTAYLFPSLGNAYNLILLPVLVLIFALGRAESRLRAQGELE